MSCLERKRLKINPAFSQSNFKLNVLANAIEKIDETD